MVLLISVIELPCWSVTRVIAVEEQIPNNRDLGGGCPLLPPETAPSCPAHRCGETCRKKFPSIHASVPVEIQDVVGRADEELLL